MRKLAGKCLKKWWRMKKINEFEYYFKFDIYLIRNSNYHYLKFLQKERYAWLNVTKKSARCAPPVSGL